MLLSRKTLIIEAVVELVIAVILIAVSIPVWQNFEKNGYHDIVEYYSSYEVSNN